MKEEKLNQLKEKLTTLSHLNSTQQLLHWDQQVHMPKQATKARSKITSTLSKLNHEQILADDFAKLIEEAKTALDKDKLNDRDAAIVREAYREYDREKKLPSDFVEELSSTTSKAHEKWVQAKEEEDYSIFEPVLKKIVELKQKEAKLVGFEDSPYDALLDVYEPYLTTEEIEPLFEDLKNFLVPFLEKIKKSNKEIDRTILEGKYPKEKQKKFNKKLLKQIGFDFDQGVLAESTHPFTVSFHPTDVRLTTRYREDDILKSIFPSIHEGGHALYEQGLKNEDFGTPLGESSSFGIHESQSRIWELMIGSSKPFWKYFYPKLQEEFEDQFSDITLQEFYEAINKVEPSFIRVAADEVTYNLHIIIRFELEKALIEGEITVSELPSLWNQKMKEYLGIEPDRPSQGVLQDIHWSNGLFGYFPTYTLGTLYAAQFFAQAKKEIEGLEEKIAQGEFQQLLEWLRDNIHTYGKYYKPEDLVEHITGERLNSDHFIDYIKQKYSDIYKLD
jgi:carboxypeptidase Taq